eukprot:TRINITY_DN8919_c0_g1_i4.p3 TRINITY_DN8919_c0_g1~~TRINITY_DN8919_c0_g1_i4.p3  ORF type:complete len:359 (+),score=80.99 TRINITY_DN8919_c0_g1_i4:28-1077(+)
MDRAGASERLLLLELLRELGSHLFDLRKGDVADVGLVRVQLGVVLVVILGHLEAVERLEGGHDGVAELALLGGDERLGGLLFLLVGVEDRAAVVRADVAALAVEGGRVVRGEVDLEQGFVGDDLRVVHDADRLGVAGRAGGDLLVGDGLDVGADVATGVAARDVVDALELLEDALDAPEAAAGEVGHADLAQRRDVTGFGEGQALAIDAEPHAGGLRAVVEDVAEVAVAASAEDLGADHAVAGVFLDVDVLVSDGLEEAGPARAAGELGVAGEERELAAGTGVDAVLFVIEQRAAEGGLGAGVAEDLVGLGAQPLLPLGFAELETGHLDRADEAAVGVEHPQGGRAAGG